MRGFVILSFVVVVSWVEFVVDQRVKGNYFRIMFLNMMFVPPPSPPSSPSSLLVVIVVMLYAISSYSNTLQHDDVIKWKHFPRYWPFVRGIHWSPVNSPHKGQWRGALMFSLIYARINTGETGDLRRHHAHYDVIVMTRVDCHYPDPHSMPATSVLNWWM